MTSEMGHCYCTILMTFFHLEVQEQLSEHLQTQFSVYLRENRGFIRTYCLSSVLVRYVSPKGGADHHSNKHCLHLWKKKQMKIILMHTIIMCSFFKQIIFSCTVTI